jgi:hypothetical protein
MQVTHGRHEADAAAFDPGLPDKLPDSTDWMLEVLGAGAGFLLATLVRTQMLLRPPLRRTPPRAIGAGREPRRF